MLYFFSIILISSSISDITVGKARMIDTLQICLYAISALLSLIATYLIAYRIISSARGQGKGYRLRHLVDIIVQSSVTYTLALVLNAVLSSPRPASEHTGSEKRPWHCMHVRASHFTHLHASTRICTHLHAPKIAICT